MFNLIRADLYRLLCGKSVYIMFLVLIIILSIETIPLKQGILGIDYGTIEELKELSEQIDINNNALIASLLSMISSHNLVFYLLVILYTVVAVDFNDGTIKNTIANGIPRIKIFFSKLIIVAISSIFLLLIKVLYPTILIIISNNSGSIFSIEYLQNIILPFAMQSFMFIVISCIGVSVGFITRKAATLNTIFIALFLAPTILILTLSSISNVFIKLLYFDINYCMQLFAYSNVLNNVDFIRTFIIGILYLLLSTILGITIFKKVEIS